ncbi:hypothetical protein AB0C93_20220 [Streptomyces sp. NPDC048518]|uniref:hypothetical protein n=1 Tax=Streptomyces sp. NPDC048518 TaxID=3155029 RepID=UPI0033DA0A98
MAAGVTGFVLLGGEDEGAAGAIRNTAAGSPERPARQDPDATADADSDGSSDDGSGAADGQSGVARTTV